MNKFKRKFNFSSNEKSLYIAWAYFRDVMVVDARNLLILQKFYHKT